MKKSYLYPIVLAALPLLVVAQDYNLVIHTKSGETIEYATKDIEKIDFEEAMEPGGTLKTPTVECEPLSDTSYKMTWSVVPKADYYSWNLDGVTTSTTEETSYTFKNLAEGTHTFSVKAMASNDSPYFDSDYGRVTFTVTKKPEAGTRVRFVIENYTHDWARISFKPGEDGDYYVAVIPAADASTDQEVASVVNALPSDKKQFLNRSQELQFSGLSPNTKYKVAAVSTKNSVFFREFTTEATPVPGETHTVFPRGVTANSGFYDVDKVGDNIYGSDTPLCWACVTAAMCQWWIDDYKATEGKDYPLFHQLPETSLYYTTPIMDVISQAYVHQAGVPESVLKWFFTGIEHPESYFVNDICAFQLDYKYVKGGFLGMTDAESDEFIVPASRTNMYRGLDPQQTKDKFADIMLGWLRNGPVYFNVSTGNHALLAWGAEYTVQADGKKLITKLYVSENDLKAGNVINGLNEARVEYSNNADDNYPYIYMPTLNSGGGPAPLGDIGFYTAIRSWDAVNGK